MILSQQGFERRDRELGVRRRLRAAQSSPAAPRRHVFQVPVCPLRDFFIWARAVLVSPAAEVIEEEDTVQVVDLVLTARALTPRARPCRAALALERLEPHAEVTLDAP